ERYRLERRLGAGGFGVVWLAFDEKLEREVAVKVIPREDDEPIPQRAAREARVAARLNHPGIVALYELAADDEAVYPVSELAPGGRCRARDAGRAPWPAHRPPLVELRTARARAADRPSGEGGLGQPATLERLGPTRTERMAGAPALGRGAGLLARVAAGLAAGGLGLAALESFGHRPSFSPFAAAGIAALAVALLPRIGWIAAAIALVAWL